MWSSISRMLAADASKCALLWRITTSLEARVKSERVPAWPFPFTETSCTEKRGQPVQAV
jgi:hypothetical protein